MRAPIRTEIFAGLTNFFTMLYIVIVNPTILSTPGTGMSFSGTLTATVLLCFSMTLFMGLYAKIPFAVAPGMGLNAFFTFSIILGKQIPWPIALGMIFWSGLFCLAISLTPLRSMIALSIPKNLRSAAAVGIGLFLTFLGLKNAGLVVGDPVTFVRFGGLGPTTLLSLFGLLVCIYLFRRKNPLAFVIGIAVVTAIAAVSGLLTAPTEIVSLPDFESVFLKLDIWGAFKLALLPAIFTIALTDLFDSLSTFMGVAQANKLLDEKGEPKNLKEGLAVDAWASFLSPVFGTSPGTAYIESSAGIEAGGRTGLTSVVTALCFLPCFFFAPLAGMVPAYATAPVLIIVGALMFKSVEELRFQALEDLIPAFLTIILIPLTFSITQGILWGFISHVILYFVAGRRREVPRMTMAIAIVCVALLFLEHR